MNTQTEPWKLPRYQIQEKLQRLKRLTNNLRRNTARLNETINTIAFLETEIGNDMAEYKSLMAELKIKETAPLVPNIK